MDALNTSPKQNDQYDTLPHPVSGTETRSLSLSHLVKPQVSASPALTVDATSIYSVDASGEEEDDEEVVILDHLSVRQLFSSSCLAIVDIFLVAFVC